MSRPKVPEGLKKTEKVALSFTRDAAVKLRMLAAEQNMDLKDWAERQLLDLIPHSGDTDRTALPSDGDLGPENDS
jgi:hypothetical protein